MEEEDIELAGKLYEVSVNNLKCLVASNQSIDELSLGVIKTAW